MLPLWNHSPDESSRVWNHDPRLSVPVPYSALLTLANIPDILGLWKENSGWLVDCDVLIYHQMKSDFWQIVFSIQLWHKLGMFVIKWEPRWCSLVFCVHRQSFLAAQGYFLNYFHWLLVWIWRFYSICCWSGIGQETAVNAGFLIEL